MTKWKTVRIRQELLDAAARALETGKYRSLSEFVAEAIQMRLATPKPSEEKAEKSGECVVVQERLLCSPKHMWATVTPAGTIRVGLSSYAQARLKAVANIQIASIGSDVNRKEPFGFVETWMFRFDLFAPVSGKIVKTNTRLLDKPEAIANDPYATGWIAEIEPRNLVTLEEELRDLMSSRQYRIWAETQRHLLQAKP